MINLKRTIVIEDHTTNENNAEWFLSFNGINPDEKDIFRMVDCETAKRLSDYINNDKDKMIKYNVMLKK